MENLTKEKRDLMLKFKVGRLAIEQIKNERDKLLKSCLANNSCVDKHHIAEFERFLTLEKSIDYSTILTNKPILRLALERCKEISFYTNIDTDDLQEQIQNAIDNMLTSVEDGTIKEV